MKKTLTILLSLAFSCFLINAAFGAGGGGVVTADPTKHFDPKGTMPSEFTIELQNGLRKSLPFEDKRDFEEAKKGFIAAPPYKQIMAEAGNVAWDMGSYEFLLTDKKYDTIHPSLQRQAVEWLTKRMCAAARSRSLHLLALWIMPFPRMSTPVMP